MQATGFVALPPRPASRPRFTCRGRFAVAYTDKPYREWLDRAASLIADLPMPDGWDPSVPLNVSVCFRLIRPKTSKLDFPKPDLDNYEKSFLDAVTQAGNVWNDDCQVVSMTSSKAFVAEDEGIHFRITPVCPNTHL